MSQDVPRNQTMARDIRRRLLMFEILFALIIGLTAGATIQKKIDCNTKTVEIHFGSNTTKEQ